MILGYVDEEGNVIDRHRHFVKEIDHEADVIMEFSDVKAWLDPIWGDWHEKRGLEKGVGTIEFCYDKIIYTRPIIPRQAFRIEFPFFLMIRSFIQAGREWKLKRNGSLHYLEIPLSCINYVYPRSWGFKISITGEEGQWGLFTFRKRTDDIRIYLIPFKIEPIDWNEVKGQVVDTLKKNLGFGKSRP